MKSSGAAAGSGGRATGAARAGPGRRHVGDWRVVDDRTRPRTAVLEHHAVFGLERRTAAVGRPARHSSRTDARRRTTTASRRAPAVGGVTSNCDSATGVVIGGRRRCRWRRTSTLPAGSRVAACSTRLDGDDGSTAAPLVDGARAPRRSKDGSPASSNANSTAGSKAMSPSASNAIGSASGLGLRDRRPRSRRLDRRLDRRARGSCGVSAAARRRRRDRRRRPARRVRGARSSAPLRHFEQRRLGFGEVGLDRRRIEGGVELGLEGRPARRRRPPARADGHVDDRRHEAQLGVEDERGVVAKGAVDQALHPRADDAPGDDEVGVGGGDADAGAGADEQARVALEQDAAAREVDQVDLGSADDARRDRAERASRMTRAGTALFARHALGDLLVRLHVVAHRFTHVRADRTRPDAPS